MTEKYKNILLVGLVFLLVGMLAFGRVENKDLGIAQVQTTDTIGTLRTTVNALIDSIQNTTSTLGLFASLSSTTGNIIVGSSSSWVVKTVGSNGKVLTASSTAAGGISWETIGAGVTSINGLAGVITGLNIYNTTTTINGLSGAFTGVNLYNTTTTINGLSGAVTGNIFNTTTTINGLSGAITANIFNTTTTLNGLSGALTNLSIFNATTTWGGLTGNIVVRTSSSIGIATTTTGFAGFGARNYPIQWTIENPTSTESDFLFNFNTTSTITKVIVSQKSTGDVWTGWNMAAATSSASATTTLSNLFTTAQLSSRTTTTQTYTPNSNTVAGLGYVLRLFNTSATAPSSSQWSATIYYNEN